MNDQEFTDEIDELKRKLRRLGEHVHCPWCSRPMDPDVDYCSEECTYKAYVCGD